MFVGWRSIVWTYDRDLCVGYRFAKIWPAQGRSSYIQWKRLDDHIGRPSG